MSWFKVDDKLWGNQKWIATPARSRGLWITAGSWSADQETDGAIPRHMLMMLGGSVKDAQALVSAGLWEVDGTGWRFHEWEAFQPTKAGKAEKRKEWRERKAGQRRDSAGQFSGTPADVPDVSTLDIDGTLVGVTPSPSRPVPSTTEPDGSAAVAAPPQTAQSLVAAWIDHCGERPPSRVIGQVSKELAAMLAEGVPYATVQAGLVAWSRKGLHPSALASVVHETRQGGRRRPTPAEGVLDVVQMAERMQAEIDASAGAA